MPQRLAQLNPTRARKDLLVATAQVQRAQFLAHLHQAGTMAREATGQARQRLQWVAMATAGIGLLAAWSTSRRPNVPSQKGNPGLIDRALPLLRLAVSLWISNRSRI